MSSLSHIIAGQNLGHRLILRAKTFVAKVSGHMIQHTFEWLFGNWRGTRPQLKCLSCLCPTACALQPYTLRVSDLCKMPCEGTGSPQAAEHRLHDEICAPSLDSGIVLNP